MECVVNEEMLKDCLQYAFYLNILITIILMWVSFRSGAHYQFFRKAEEAHKQGLGNFSNENGPAILDIMKLQAKINFSYNCAFLLISFITAFILYTWLY
ncbi:TPA: hypothetical protein ROS15_000750 [Escherichia coli]|uniref:hypothetical protein n=1 Tax=Leclercia adecarboxylata TaxID=83655 RepID=UPI0011AAD258|nr:hypothetical protein [Leclercia adecarboxylata]EGL2905383.1 hypothetical protein [Salmonella enterica]HDX5640361.1 hypothetical protein [Escherichia coli]